MDLLSVAIEQVDILGAFIANRDEAADAAQKFDDLERGVLFLKIKSLERPAACLACRRSQGIAPDDPLCRQLLRPLGTASPRPCSFNDWGLVAPVSDGRIDLHLAKPGFNLSL